MSTDTQFAQSIRHMVQFAVAAEADKQSGAAINREQLETIADHVTTMLVEKWHETNERVATAEEAARRGFAEGMEAARLRLIERFGNAFAEALGVADSWNPVDGEWIPDGPSVSAASTDA